MHAIGMASMGVGVLGEWFLLEGDGGENRLSPLNDPVIVHGWLSTVSRRMSFPSTFHFIIYRQLVIYLLFWKSKTIC